MAELSTIARPYAEALFAAAQQDSTAGLEAWSSLLAELGALAQLPDVREALTDPRLDFQARVSLFTGLVKSSLPPKAQNLIALLVSNDRMLALPEIVQQFDELRHRFEGSAQAQITSAFALSEDQVQTLVAALEKKFGLKLKPSVTVDDSLIGGVRVVVGDQVLDTSVRARLAQMRDTLAA